MPTAAASLRWLAARPVFKLSSTSHIGREPPASPSASSNARLTTRAARARLRPSGGRIGRISPAYTNRIDLKEFDIKVFGIYAFRTRCMTDIPGGLDERSADRDRRD